MKKTFLVFLYAFFITVCTFAQTADSAKDWTISLQMWTFRVFTFHDAVVKADSCGIKYLQAFPGQKLGGNWEGVFGPEMSANERKEVKEFVKSKDQTFIGFGVTGAKDEAEWRRLFEFAKDMDIPLIITEPDNNQWDYVDRLAGEFNIRVAIHDHPRPSHYWNPDTVIAAMKGHPNIGACADIGHWARSGLNLIESLQKLQGRIWNIHLKDVGTFDDVKAEDVMPGQGVIDFPAVFKELKRQNYKGSFSIEHESNWENNAGDVIQIVRFYHDQVKSLE